MGSSKTIGSLRLDVETIERMKQAIQKYNQSPSTLTLMNEAAFRRLAIEVLAQLILSGKPLPIKVQHD